MPGSSVWIALAMRRNASASSPGRGSCSLTTAINGRCCSTLLPSKEGPVPEPCPLISSGCGVAGTKVFTPRPRRNRNANHSLKSTGEL